MTRATATPASSLVVAKNRPTFKNGSAPEFTLRGLLHSRRRQDYPRDPSTRSAFALA